MKTLFPVLFKPRLDDSANGNDLMLPVRVTQLERFASSLFLGVLGAGVLLAAWLLFQEATKRAVITELSDATRMGDLHALNQKTDWNSLRNWMKKDLKQRHAPQHAASQTIDRVVDYYLRPDSLPGLLHLYKTNAGAVAPEAFVRNARFSGLTEMTIEIALPPQLDKPWLNKMEPVRAVFQLEGLDWKLKRINAPDHLISASLPFAVAQRP